MDDTEESLRRGSAAVATFDGPARAIRGARSRDESYLESTDGGATFTPLAVIDTVPVKTGPICTQGINCSGDRELLDFQSVTVDGAGRANAAWTRSIDGVSDTELRFARQ